MTDASDDVIAFMGGQGTKARSIALSATVSPSLKTILSGGNAIPEVAYRIKTTDGNIMCYGIDSHPMDSRIRLQDPDEPVQTLSRKMYKGTADVPMVLIDKKSDCADTVKSPPDRVFQNTGHGWWTESTVCQTVRTPCGGDAPKANLIVEELNAECDYP